MPEDVQSRKPESQKSTHFGVIGNKSELEALRIELKNCYEKNYQVTALSHPQNSKEHSLTEVTANGSPNFVWSTHNFKGQDSIDLFKNGQHKTNGHSKNGSNFKMHDSGKNLSQKIKKNSIDQLIVSSFSNNNSNIQEILDLARDHDVKILNFANAYRKLFKKEPFVPSNGQVHVYDFDISNPWGYSIWQNSLNWFFASLCSLLLMPLWIITALAIKLESKGPVIYRQTRVGQDGEDYTLYKFRTMTVNAEDNEAQWAQEDDHRVTTLGKILRRTRFDETLQFLNVLKGDMNLIGPRPERPEFVEELQDEVPFFELRQADKPGITGWAQVHYPYCSSFYDSLQKVQYDLHWLRNRSIWMDMKIIFRTIWIVFGSKGR